MKKLIMVTTILLVVMLLAVTGILIYMKTMLSKLMGVMSNFKLLHIMNFGNVIKITS